MIPHQNIMSASSLSADFIAPLVMHVLEPIFSGLFATIVKIVSN